jgi:hypothetical protein
LPSLREQPEESSVGLINWIFDFYQQSRIERLHEDAARARAQAMALRSSSGSVDTVRLERAMGELALAVKTIQRVAVEKGLCTSAEFQQRMNDIDAEDGRTDGISPIP